MKKNLLLVMASGILLLFTTPTIAQKQVSMSQGAMTWTSKSAQAKKLTAIGFFYLLNVEREQAYQYFKQAIEADPNFTVALTFLSNLSTGEAKKEFAQKAQQSAMNKTEGEKLFVAIVDEKTTADQRREIWSKLHVMYPNDRAIGHLFATSRATAEERFDAMKEYVQKYPEEPAAYNMLGYYYMLDQKDNATAKTYFEKYIQLYPDGANPYDSMGEFYLTTGDVENAEKYYKMALEKYPFMVSSIQALQKIAEEKKKTDKN
jgi:tetratricopeptide (TPR) repeat protein